MSVQTVGLSRKGNVIVLPVKAKTPKPQENRSVFLTVRDVHCRTVGTCTFYSPVMTEEHSTTL